MTLVFIWYHTYSLCSVRRQLTHCARLNIHKYYLQTLSSIITIMLVCPRCGTSNLHNRRCGDGDAAVTAVAATATSAGTDNNKKEFMAELVYDFIFSGRTCAHLRTIGELDERSINSTRTLSWFESVDEAQLDEDVDLILRIRPIEVLGCKTRDDDDEESDDDEKQMATPVRWYATRFTTGN